MATAPLLAQASAAEQERTLLWDLPRPVRPVLLPPTPWETQHHAPPVQKTLALLLAQVCVVQPIITRQLAPLHAQRVWRIRGAQRGRGNVLLTLGTICRIIHSCLVWLEQHCQPLVKQQAQQQHLPL